jgi:hypothetical protein
LMVNGVNVLENVEKKEDTQINHADLLFNWDYHYIETTKYRSIDRKSKQSLISNWVNLFEWQNLNLQSFINNEKFKQVKYLAKNYDTETFSLFINWVDVLKWKNATSVEILLDRPNTYAYKWKNLNEAGWRIQDLYRTLVYEGKQLTTKNDKIEHIHYNSKTDRIVYRDKDFNTTREDTDWKDEDNYELWDNVWDIIIDDWKTIIFKWTTYFKKILKLKSI